MLVFSKSENTVDNNTNTNSMQIAGADKFCSLLVLLFILFAAASTLAYHIVLFSQVPVFFWYPIVLTIFLIFIGIFRKELFPIQFHIDKSIGFLLLLCALSTCINIFTLRPDMDDISFFFRALSYAERLSHPISKTYALFGLEGVPELSTFHHMTAFETGSALIAKALDIPGMAFVHQGVGGMALFLMPIIYYKLFRTLGFSSMCALLGILGALLYLILNGSTPAALGNYTIIRAWQGKCFLIFLMLPLLWTYVIRFMASGRTYDLWVIYGITISGVGLSGTAFFLLPFSAGLLCLAHILLANNKPQSTTRTLVVGTALLIPLLYTAISYSGLFIPVHNTDVWKFISYPSSLEWQFSFVLPRKSAIILSLLFCGFFVVRKYVTANMKIFYLYSLATLTVPLIPGISGTLMHIITPTVFWRLFTAFPGAALFGCCWIYAFSATKNKRAVAMACMGTITLFMWWINTPVLNRGVISPPHIYKFPSNDLRISLFLRERIARNSLVAGPEAVIGVLAPLRPDLRFFSERPAAALHVLANATDPTLLEKREPWIRYLGSPCDKRLLHLTNPDCFKEVDFLVLPRCVAPFIDDVTKHSGLNGKEFHGDYVFLSKSAPF